MRRSSLPLLLALGLFAAPLATVPAAAASGTASSASTAQAGSVTQRARLIGPATTTQSLRLAGPATTRTLRLARPAARKPAPRPVAKPVAKPAAAPTSAPVTKAAAPAPQTGAYAFLHVDAGAPVRWNPCADVPWTFNPAGAPAGGLAAVQAAVAELSRTTGLSFAYQGQVGTTPSGSYLQQSWKQFRPLLVGWTSAGGSDLLAGRDASTVGMTRVLWTGSYDSSGANHTQIASGVVAFNRATKAGTTGAASWYTYALHELGHAVGLAHVARGSEVMNPVIGNDITGYGSGDRAGLAEVGRGAGCLPDVR